MFLLKNIKGTISLKTTKVIKMEKGNEITVKTTVHAPIEKVWEYWNEPEHMTKWSHASDDWHTPYAENDLRVGGKFVARMEAKDGSFGFDFGGVYDEVKLHEVIAYTMEDGRTVKVMRCKKFQ